MRDAAHKRLQSIWYGMKARCGNPKAINYKNYGARGEKWNLPQEAA